MRCCLLATVAVFLLLPGEVWAKRGVPSASQTDAAGDQTDDESQADSPAEANRPSESELMFRALNATRGESPNAARIERVSAAVLSESKRKRSTEQQITQFWKDPFAEDPEAPIAVRPAAYRPRQGSAPVGQRALVRELARARAETAVAQAQAASARAEAARAKATAARAEASAARAEALTARREAEAARSACADEPGGGKRRSIQARGQIRPREARNASETTDRTDALSLASVPRSVSSSSRIGHLTGRASVTRTRRAAGPTVTKTTEPSLNGLGEPNEAAPEPEPPPAAFTSSTGILVVPMTR